jgi:probable rRNA maturation factor
MGVRIRSPRKKGATVKALRTQAEKILQKLGQPESGLGVHLVDDREIRRLNRKFRRLDAATDVLSFSVDLDGVFKGPSAPPRLLGDVVISYETARRQAAERGHSTRREMGELLIHGVLHLLGYDHEKEAEARRMRRKEWRLREECLDG